MTDARRFFVVRGFRTECGVVLPEARLAHGTCGSPDAPRGVVLVPSHFIAGSADNDLIIKVLAIDHVNDIAQAVVRPAAGGIVFGCGTASETPAISDPGGFLASGGWAPVAIGVVLALTVHLGKAGTRAVANTATVGVAAPVLSTVEDVSSVALVAAAILLPALVACCSSRWLSDSSCSCGRCAAVARDGGTAAPYSLDRPARLRGVARGRPPPSNRGAPLGPRSVPPQAGLV